MSTNYYLKKEHKCGCEYCGYQDKHLGKLVFDGVWCKKCNMRAEVKNDIFKNTTLFYCKKCNAVEVYEDDKKLKKFENRGCFIYAVNPKEIDKLNKKDKVINEYGEIEDGLSFKKRVKKIKNKNFDNIGQVFD
jgi:hypothetical protein